jgi:excinuclease ABC subunit C
MIAQAELQSILQSLPQKPGVYRFIGAGQTLLYIGKAKNLKNRVSSYFQNRPQNARISLMISQIESIDYTQTATEKEALLLEANMIFTNQPKYNVLLKEEKNYVYIRLTATEIPTFQIVRHKFDPDSKYFGPFLSYSKANQIMATVRSIFPYCAFSKPSVAKIDEN